MLPIMESCGNVSVENGTALEEVHAKAAGRERFYTAAKGK